MMEILKILTAKITGYIAIAATVILAGWLSVTLIQKHTLKSQSQAWQDSVLVLNTALQDTADYYSFQADSLRHAADSMRGIGNYGVDTLRIPYIVRIPGKDSLVSGSKTARYVAIDTSTEFCLNRDTVGVKASGKFYADSSLGILNWFNQDLLYWHHHENALEAQAGPIKTRAVSIGAAYSSRSGFGPTLSVSVKNGTYDGKYFPQDKSFMVSRTWNILRF